MFDDYIPDKETTVIFIDNDRAPVSSIEYNKEGIITYVNYTAPNGYEYCIPASDTEWLDAHTVITHPREGD